MANYRAFRCVFTCVLFAACLVVLAAGGAPANAYDIGTPVLTDIWVDPVNGNDGRSGADRTLALRTLDEAWSRVPEGVTLQSTGYRLLLVAGDYSAENLPGSGWMEGRYGTYQCPVIIQAADAPRSARLHGYLTFFDCRYLYLIGLNMVTDLGYGGGGNVIHVAGCRDVLIRNCKLDGYDGTVRQPQEALKVNQTQYMYVEDSDISGAFWFSLDYVAVQFGYLFNNRIHNSGDDGVVLKGGSAYLLMQGNTVYDTGGIGIAVGQGTGFEFMVNPWLHYEAYDVKVVNNVVRETQRAGMAVRGGYNILLAHNTLYRVGLDQEAGAALLLFSPGARSCDGDAAAALERHNAGGWGPTYVTEGGEWIPNRHVYVFNNIIYNPAPVQTRWSHFDIFGPVYPPAGTNIPSPAYSDDDLRIRGNVIWNGPPDFPLGIGEGTGGQPSNPTCNETQLPADNAINTLEPQLVNPTGGDFRPVAGGTLARATTYPIPNFAWTDAPHPPTVPAGNPNNAVAMDFNGAQRAVPDTAGAFTLNTGPLSAVSLTANLAAPRPTGTSITLIATPTGNSTVVYKFRVGYLVGTTWQWTVLRQYGASRWCVWRPTEARRYTLVVMARQADSTAPFQVTASMSYLITPPLTAVGLAAAPASPQRVGTPITLTAAPTGGARVQYRFRAGIAVNGIWMWATLCDYSTQATCRWTPTNPGAYTLTLEARDANSLTPARVTRTTGFIIRP